MTTVNNTVFCLHLALVSLPLKFEIIPVKTVGNKSWKLYFNDQSLAIELWTQVHFNMNSVIVSFLWKFITWNWPTVPLVYKHNLYQFNLSQRSCMDIHFKRNLSTKSKFHELFCLNTIWHDGYVAPKLICCSCTRTHQFVVIYCVSQIKIIKIASKLFPLTSLYFSSFLFSVEHKENPRKSPGCIYACC